jgi:hypothetical protein
MKRFGFGLLAAGMLAAATLLTSLPASAAGSGGGMIWIPPMGGGMGGGIGGSMGGGMGRAPGGAWHAPGGGNWANGPGTVWHGPGGRPIGGNNYHGGMPYPGRRDHGWNGNWNNNWNPNWYRNGHWYGPRYHYRYPGYNYYYGGFWYPWPWWSNVWNLQIGENYGYWNGGYNYNSGYYSGYGKRHVAWCMGRYRSYNAYTNTFTGYDGRRHRCNSPFD